ncbi:MAG: ribbon-helix-helix domain-containing protein [Caldivirga sp.]
MPKTVSERKMVLVSLHIPVQMLEELDDLVKTGVYPSRSEAIRVAIRDLILREKGKTKGGK